MLVHIRRYLIAGLLVWLPVWVTLLVIQFVFHILNNSLSLLPHKYHIPGLDIVIAFLVVFITGMVATNVIGHRLVHFGETIIKRIPLVRAIYSSVKQVLHTIMSSNGQAFRRVLLIEYPRKGVWSIAFQTGSVAATIQDSVGQKCLTAFVPTTPNPTSGFLVVVPETEVKELAMTVDDALKMVISLGVVQPVDAVPLVLASTENKA